MIKNYFKTAFRNLWRNKTFSVIKILGLSNGLAALVITIALIPMSFQAIRAAISNPVKSLRTE